MIPSKIMVIDDNADNLRLVQQMLDSSGYEVFALPNGAMALRAAELNPPDLILLDIAMPEMDGYEVCRRIKANAKLKNIPVIFLSAHGSVEDKVTAISVGGADFLNKPIQHDDLLTRVNSQLKLNALATDLNSRNDVMQRWIAGQNQILLDVQMGTLFCVAKLAEARDPNIGQHLERVRLNCRSIALYLMQHPPYDAMVTPTFVDQIFHAAPLHDIGKIRVPETILLKGEELSAVEWVEMKKHCDYGADQLRAMQQDFPDSSFLQVSIDIIGSHHERWDGLGYPQGLTGKDIPLAARIFALVDIYDTVCHQRCYKQAGTHEEAVSIIEAARGNYLDPVIVDAFLALERDFLRVSRIFI